MAWISISPVQAALNVTISTGATTGGSFAGGVWIPTGTPSRINVNDLLSAMSANATVTIQTNGPGAEPGNITISNVVPFNDIAGTGGRTLILNAINDVVVNAAMNQSGVAGPGSINAVNLTCNANSDASGGGSTTLAADIETGGGTFTASGLNFTQNATRNLDTSGAGVTINITGAVSLLGNSITTSGGAVGITGADDSTLTSAITTSGGNITATLSGAGNDWVVNAGMNANGGAGTGSVDIRSNGGTLTVNSSALFSTGGSGTATLRAAGAMTLHGDISTLGGIIDIRTTAPGNLSVESTSLLSALGGGNAGSIDLVVNNGNVTLAAGSQVRSGTAGDVSISAGGALSDVIMAGTVSGGSGGVLVSANRDLSHTGSTTSGGGITQLGADMNFDGTGLASFGGSISLGNSGVLNLRGGTTTVSGTVDTNGNNTLIQARNAATVSGDVITDGGNMQVSASSGGAGLLDITATGSLDARGGGNTGIVTLSNGGGNIQNNGEVRSGTAGRLFAQAGGVTGSITNNGILVGGTESLFGTTLRANNGITIGATASTSGSGTMNLSADFDNSTSGDIILNSAISGNGGVSVAGAAITGNAGASITSQNNTITINGSGAVDILPAMDSNGGNISITAGTTLDLGAGLLSSDGGVVTLLSSNTMNLFGPITTSGGAFNADVTDVGNLAIQNDITTAGGSVDITTVNGQISNTAGSTIDASGGAGTAAVRLESLAGSQSLLIQAGVTSGSGGANLRAGGNVTINNAVNGGGGAVQLVANSESGVLGNLSVNAGVSTTGGGTITLGGVDFSQAGTGTIGATGGNVSGTFTGIATVARAITSTTGTVGINAPTLSLNAQVSGGGGITLGGTSITGNSGGTITAQNNTITINGTGAVDIIDVIDSNGGNIGITAGTTLDLGTGLLSSDGGVVTLLSTSAMTLSGPITTSGGAFNADVTGAGNLAIENDITTSGGTVDITTANGLLSNTAGSTVDASGGAGTAAVRMESLQASQNLLIGAGVTSGSGGANLRAGGNVTINGVVNGGDGAVQLVANSDLGFLGNLSVNAGVSTTGSGIITLGGVNFSQTGTGTIGAAGGNVSGTFTGTATVARAVTSTTGTVGISAPTLNLNAPVSGGGGITLGGTSITGNSGGTITAQNNTIIINGTGAVDIIDVIDSNGGNIGITAGTTLELGTGLLSSDGGVVTLLSTNAMTLSGPITTSGGAFNADVTGAGTLAIQNDITTSGGTVDITTANGLLSSTAGSDVNASGGAGTAAVRLESLNGLQDVNLSGSVSGGSGGTQIRAGNHVTLNGSVTSNGGLIALAADTNNGGVGDLTVAAPFLITGGAGLTVSGINLVQGGTGSLTTSGGAINGTFTGAVTFSRAVSSNGGQIRFTANAITVSSLLSTAPPVGGTGILHASSAVVINTAPVLGNADIILLAGSVSAPTVATSAFADVTSHSATLGGNVTSDGGVGVIERGIVWRTSSGPTTADNKVSNGSGTGVFSGTVGSLPAGTTVYVRAYATNIIDTSYGSEISFNTPELVVTGVTSSSANSTYRIGEVVSIQVNFSQPVNVTGTPQISLETGSVDRTINYTSGSGTSSLTFLYTVQSGDSTTDLDYTGTSALALNGGTIQDAGLNNATLTLPTPGSANSLGANKAIVIDGVRPTAGIVVADTTLTMGETSLVTITFSEAVTGFTSADLLVENGSLSSLSTGDGGITWTATLTPSNVIDATNVITLDNTGVQDFAGNTGIGTTNSNNYAIDIKSVSIAATDADADENTADTGTWRVSRNNTVGNLTVQLTIDASSTATAADWNQSGATIASLAPGSSGSVVIPDGQSFVDITLTPLADIQAEAAETVRLNLTAPVDHVITGPADATVTIGQNDFVVINTNDAGEGSLRQAVLNANAIIGTDTITFSDGTGGTVNFTDASMDTITLTTGQLVISSNVVVQGTGAQRLSLNGNAASRIFHINSGAVTRLSDLTITNGRHTTSWGGALNVVGGSAVTVLRCVVSNSTSQLNGGGIYVSGSTLDVVNTTISGNSATGGGGAISDGTAASSGTIRLLNTTITGNTGSDGGAINFGLNPTVTITNCTITNNAAIGATGSASGIVMTGGSFTISNSIIAGNVNNANNPDLTGAFTSGGGNIIGNVGTATGFTATNDLTGTGISPVDPQIGPLQNNGGNTPTHALLPSSPAVNRGVNANLPQDTLDIDGDSNTTETLPLDQALEPRVYDNPTIPTDIVDIGAMESQNSPPTVVVPGIADVSKIEDDPAFTIDLLPHFADAEQANTTLSYSVFDNSNPSLVSASITGGTNVQITPQANQTGFADITIRATDNGNLTVDDTFRVTITKQVDLVASVVESVDPVLAGVSMPGNLQHQIQVLNNGPSDATNVTVNVAQTLPAGVTVANSSATSGNFAAGVWTIPAIAEDTMQTLTLTLTVAANTAAGTDTIVTTGTVNSVTEPIVVTSDDADTERTSVFSASAMPLNLTTGLLGNFQNGLIEQRLRVTNNNTGPVPAFRVVITGLPSDVTVFNKQGTTSGGAPYILWNQPLAGNGGIANLLVQFHRANGSANFTPVYTIELLGTPVTAPLPGGATQITISRTLRMTDDAFLVEWISIPGRSYRVRWSPDMTTWHDVLPDVKAVANKTQWIDAGPPQTTSHPSTASSRFYQIHLLP
jgi:hypothetical protein